MVSWHHHHHQQHLCSGTPSPAVGNSLLTSAARTWPGTCVRQLGDGTTSGSTLSACPSHVQGLARRPWSAALGDTAPPSVAFTLTRGRVRWFGQPRANQQQASRLRSARPSSHQPSHEARSSCQHRPRSARIATGAGDSIGSLHRTAYRSQYRAGGQPIVAIASFVNEFAPRQRGRRYSGGRYSGGAGDLRPTIDQCAGWASIAERSSLTTTITYRDMARRRRLQTARFTPAGSGALPAGSPVAAHHQSWLASRRSSIVTGDAMWRRHRASGSERARPADGERFSTSITE